MTEITRLARAQAAALLAWADREESALPPPDPTPDPVPPPDPAPPPDPTPPPPGPTPSPSPAPQPGVDSFIVPAHGDLAKAFATINSGGKIDIVEDITLTGSAMLGKQTGAGLNGVTVEFKGSAKIIDACLPPIKNALVLIGAPGCKLINFSAVGNFGHLRRCLKVYDKAHGLVIDGFRAQDFAFHCIDIDADDCRIVNYEIHRILGFDSSQPGNRIDAHGIVTLSSNNLFIGAGKIWQCSGDCFQGDRGAGWNNVLIDGADWFDAPLEQDVNGFTAGTYLSENAVDTKTAMTNKTLTIRNSKFHGFRSKVLLPSGYYGIAAALNIKEMVTAIIYNVEIYDCEVGLRAVGVRNNKWSHITFMASLIHDCDDAVRGEDKLKNFVFLRNKMHSCKAYWKKGSAGSEPWDFAGWQNEFNEITDTALVGKTWPVASGDKAAIGTAPMDFPIPPITHDGTSAVRNNTNQIVAQ